ncbi:MAG: hypothetical protein OXF02_01290 [Simkaniaceae bacterium]|nr:hypothetical protein [Simkaniaceae bacterium]
MTTPSDTVRASTSAPRRSGTDVPVSSSFSFSSAEEGVDVALETEAVIHDVLNKVHADGAEERECRELRKKLSGVVVIVVDDHADGKEGKVWERKVTDLRYAKGLSSPLRIEFFADPPSPQMCVSRAINDVPRAVDHVARPTIERSRRIYERTKEVLFTVCTEGTLGVGFVVVSSLGFKCVTEALGASEEVTVGARVIGGWVPVILTIHSVIRTFYRYEVWRRSQ